MRQEIGIKMRALVLDRLSRNFVSPTVPIVCGLSLAFIACVYGSLEPDIGRSGQARGGGRVSPFPTASAQDVADTIAMGMRASLEPNSLRRPPRTNRPTRPRSRS